ncbi:metal ABC transporter permease [Granulosicoccus antarcticus]|uniref:High-affinity zinc uptake system membrane protein ZnuB n=1 Tax=Granulosicoccus antarcticus IMCC3135 TaxID=1192854 RepID=A0A2Z2NJ71_9GAMM|nr:metal ABC transporter permease [Granulosicoccus antarcticus]ASJ70545.1 High-affinity zinc uptake system membrane protein ZnuB [Granulosicoccus antarcticus IMCC3135]
MDSFVVRAALAGIAVALSGAPIGCFVVWRRMAYFGDATAHAAILGVAASLAFGQSIFAGTLVVSLLMAYLVSTLSWRGYAMDTLLGVLAHSALAFGLVAVSFVPGVRVDLNAYLFGDILAVTSMDLLIMWVGATVVSMLIAWRWSALLLATLSPELAHASGIDPRREQLILTLSLAIVVVVAIKVVGALLITALLIIPAAAARPLSNTPERMLLVAIIVGVLSILSGLSASWFLDTPAGPTIVSVAAVIFIITNLLKPLVRTR